MSTKDADKCALVVVDMQNDYCHPRGVYSRNDLKCFDIQSVVTATARAVTECKRRGIPVIYLRMAWNTDASGLPVDAGLIVEQSRPFIRTEGLRRGTWGVEVLEGFPVILNATSLKWDTLEVFVAPSLLCFWLSARSQSRV